MKYQVDTGDCDSAGFNRYVKNRQSGTQVAHWYWETHHAPICLTLADATESHSVATALKTGKRQEAISGEKGNYSAG